MRAAAILGVAAVLVALEMRRALRKPNREPKPLHAARNLALAAGAGVVMQLIETPLTYSLALHAHRSGWGIANRLPGTIAQTAAAVLLLDYGLYVWHVLTHKVPFLWRFHLVHHIDLDLDASTAVRFHAGEMLLSVPWRLLQIAVAGASPLAVSVWQTLLLLSILFHHSNIRLPLRLERYLSYLIMTPRLHGIHHEALKAHTDSNWTSGLALWDMIHGTRLWKPRQGIIGVPGYNRIEDVILPKAIALPFHPQQNDWQWPEAPLS